MIDARRVRLSQIVAAKDCGGHSWKEIADHFGLLVTTVRAQYLHRDRHGYEPMPCPICGGRPPRSVEWGESGNHAEAGATSEEIRTLEELLAACQVDLEVWQVSDWQAKAWGLGAKVRHSDLNFDEGKITGWLRDEGLGKTTLWSVFARFVRRQPKPLRPVVSPVGCPVTYQAPPRPMEGVRRMLLLADQQFGFRRNWQTGRLDPFHSREALDVALQVAAVLQPDLIVFLGDLLDLAEMTDKFVRSVEFEQTTQPAILEAHWWLRQFREAVPNADFELHEGNHEQRMRDALAIHLRAACDLRPADEVDLPPALSPQRLLALDALGIRWVGDYPADEAWLSPTLMVCHGERANTVPGATSRAIVEGADVTVFYGHIHRRELVARTVRVHGRQRSVTACCPGCACRIDGTVPGKTANPNWQQGLAVVDYTNEDHAVTIVPIEDGRALWAGMAFRARDRLPNLQQDLKGWAW